LSDNGPFENSTELALERADVRVVDVAVTHEGDGVADGLRAEPVGHVRDPREVGAACAEQRDDLFDVDFLTGEHTVEHLTDRGTGARRPSAGSVAGTRRGGATCPPALQSS